jgi:hypothetical protein
MKTATTKLFAFELSSPFRFAKIVVVRSTADDALSDARAIMHAALNGNRAFGATKLASVKPVTIPEQDKAEWDAPKCARFNGEQLGWIASSVRWM